MKRRGLQALAVLALLPLLSGCAGYRLGSTLPPGIRSLYVPTFVNRTDEPQLEVTTTRAAIKEFQQDGTLRIVDEESADGRLDVELQQFRLEPLRYDPDNSRTTSEYRLIIIARVDFYRSGTGEKLTSRTVRGEAAFQPSGDLSLGKLDALPDAAEDLAHHIVKTVVEYW